MAKQSNSLQHSLIEVATKGFLAEAEKPNASKLQKHLDKHLAFATSVEKTDTGFSIAYGKKKDGLSVTVKTPVAKPTTTPAEAPAEG